MYLIVGGARISFLNSPILTLNHIDGDKTGWIILHKLSILKAHIIIGN